MNATGLQEKYLLFTMGGIIIGLLIGVMSLGKSITEQGVLLRAVYNVTQQLAEHKNATVT